MLILSGATIHGMLFPANVKKTAAILPMPHAVDLMQGAFAGDSLGSHTKELLILGALSVVLMSAGAVFYRKKDWA